jgi:hypothetical protein
VLPVQARGGDSERGTVTERDSEDASKVGRRISGERGAARGNEPATPELGTLLRWTPELGRADPV